MKPSFLAANALSFVIALTSAAQIAPPAPADSLAALVATNSVTCLTTTSAAAYCWGEIGRQRGQVHRMLDGNGDPARLRTLQAHFVGKCALTITDDVACDHALGGGTLDSAGKPGPVPRSCRYYLCVLDLGARAPLPAAPLRSVVTGDFHACALALNGTAYCWGRNWMGQLGDGTWAPDSTGSAGEFFRTPRAVPRLRFSQISAGETTTCGVTIPDAAIYCWGYGQSGQTGDSAVLRVCDGVRPYYTKPCSNATPARVVAESLPGDYPRQDLRFARVSVGMRLTCAVSTTNEAYCWGGNYRCALGRCQSPDSPRAHRITVPGRVVEIGAGYWHACARTAERRIFCWGDNRGGQLGSLTTINAGPDGGPPDYRDTTDHAATAAAYRDPCFLGGRCSPVPTEVAPGRRWAALAVGMEHACALSADDGGVYCWGGAKRSVLGEGAQLVACDNRSVNWGDAPCQPTPTRVPDLPTLGPSRPTALDSLAARPIRSAAERQLAATRFTVSRRQLRIVFPPDTARAWGWPESDGGGNGYVWSAVVNDSLGVPANYHVSVPRSATARDFPSFRELVAAATVQVCIAGSCQPNGSASVEDRRLVVTLSDSALIDRAFRFRPTSAQPTRSAPEERGLISLGKVTIAYIEPQLKLPDSATIAEAIAARRRYEASIRSIFRQIDGGTTRFGPLWMVVGERTRLYVNETHCHYDACMGSASAVLDSGWTIADTTIARLTVYRDSPSQRLDGIGRTRAVSILARRSGRTTVRVDGLRSTGDTMPSRQPPERALEREVNVIGPIELVEFGPRKDVRVGQPFALSLRVIERTGGVVPLVPAFVTVIDGKERTNYALSDSLRLQYSSPGRRTFVASFMGRTDTLVINVVAPAPRP